MLIVFGAVTAFGGLIAVVAGGYGLRRADRIRGLGHAAEALVKPSPPGAERPRLTFETHDGRVMEIVSPVPGLAAGDGVRLWYDPADPREVVVDGHERRGVEWAFLAVGCALIVTGLGLAVSGGVPGR
jgi:hypothetical protein